MLTVTESAIILEMDAEELEVEYRKVQRETCLTHWQEQDAEKRLNEIRNYYFQMTGTYL